MRKNDVLIGQVTQLVYPSQGIVVHGNHQIAIKGALPGQTLEFRLSKNKSNAKEGKVLQVLERAPYEVPSFCEHFGNCGGCARQTVPYPIQLDLKATAVQGLLTNAGIDLALEPILESPKPYEYRNKMEYSFGNEEKGGILNLGMHKKGRFYDVVSIPQCHLIDSDYRQIITALENLARQEGWNQFNRNKGEGQLRHTVVRKGHQTGEILVGISTTSDPLFNENLVTETLLALPLEGRIVGIMRLVNDGIGDVVKPNPEDHMLFGRDYFYEQLFDLKFKVSFFSFFQTNTLGAQVLYQKALSYMGDVNGKTVFDLFSGTGTIAQIVAEKAKKVVGVEIIEDAVEAAKINAKENGLENCQFIAGDVFAVLSALEETPDAIIVDPPRSGMMPKTVEKIASYGVAEILYISCNPKTMVENLVQFQTLGYEPVRGTLVDLYPHTDHVECVVLLTRQEL